MSDWHTMVKSYDELRIKNKELEAQVAEYKQTISEGADLFYNQERKVEKLEAQINKLNVSNQRWMEMYGATLSEKSDLQCRITDELLPKNESLQQEVEAWRARFPLAGYDGNCIVLSG